MQSIDLFKEITRDGFQLRGDYSRLVSDINSGMELSIPFARSSMDGDIRIDSQSTASSFSAINRFLGTVYTIFLPATPNSDIFFGGPGTQLILGRAGSDRALGANPADAVPGKGEIDILWGGPEISFLGPVNAPNNNIFILGDENKPYYAGGTGTLGNLDFALIVNFVPSRDAIRLNGSSSNYVLRNYQAGGATGTVLFRLGSTPDLIAVLPGVSGLNLSDSYFEYVNSPPPLELVKGAIQLGTNGFDQSFDIDSDREGNFYTTGFTTGNLGGVNAGGRDAFLAKHDRNGKQVWIRQFGTSGADLAFGVTTDSNNNIYTTGNTQGDLAAPNAGGDDVFVNKFDSNGNLLWTRQIGSSSVEFSLDIASDRDGNVFIAGFTTGDLGGPNQLPISFTDDAFIAKFDTNGNLQWIRQFGTPIYDEAYGITVDPDGNIIATGWTEGSLAVENAGLYDGWIAKYDTNGNRLWIRQFGSSEYDFPWDIVSDSFGNVYSVGFTGGSLGSPNAGFFDAFVTKYDSNGNQVWVKQFGTSGNENALAIDIDRNNNLYITGFTTGLLGAKNFGGDSAGADDAYWVKLDSDGNLLSTNQVGTSRIEQGFGIDAGVPGMVAISGITDASIGSANAGSFDAWLYLQRINNT